MLLSSSIKTEQGKRMRTTFKKFIRVMLFSAVSILTSNITTISELIKSLVDRITAFILINNNNKQEDNLKYKFIREQLMSSLSLTQLSSLKDRLIREQFGSLLLSSQLNFE